MPDWPIQDAGYGGKASPTQFWDIEDEKVRIGPRRRTIPPESPDLEMLRPARDKAGRAFPGEFVYSPVDGEALTPPPTVLDAEMAADGALLVRMDAASLLSAEPSEFPVPATEAVHAGTRRPLGLIGDLAEGKLFRWSGASGAWREIADVPRGAPLRSLRRPAATASGFVYAAEAGAVAVTRPGPELWQEAVPSPSRAMAVSPAAARAGGAVVLARATGGGLRLLLWSPDEAWSERSLAGEIGDGTGSFSPPGAGPDSDGLFWAHDNGLIMVDPAAETSVLPWPDKFAPETGAAPVVTRQAVYQLGAADKEPAWAQLSHGGAEVQIVPAPAARTTPVEGGFAGAEGWSPSPGGESDDGLRLPEGCVGRELIRFDDGVLFLAIKDNGLWVEALAGHRQVRQVRLVLARRDGRLIDLTPVQRCGRVDQVEALLLPDGVAVVGLKPGAALMWRRPG